MPDRAVAAWLRRSPHPQYLSKITDDRPPVAGDVAFWQASDDHQPVEQ